MTMHIKTKPKSRRKPKSAKPRSQAWKLHVGDAYVDGRRVPAGPTIFERHAAEQKALQGLRALQVDKLSPQQMRAAVKKLQNLASRN